MSVKNLNNLFDLFLQISIRCPYYFQLTMITYIMFSFISLISYRKFKFIVIMKHVRNPIHMLLLLLLVDDVKDYVYCYVHVWSTCQKISASSLGLVRKCTRNIQNCSFSKCDSQKYKSYLLINRFNSYIFILIFAITYFRMP